MDAYMNGEVVPKPGSKICMYVILIFIVRTYVNDNLMHIDYKNLGVGGCWFLVAGCNAGIN